MQRHASTSGTQESTSKTTQQYYTEQQQSQQNAISPTIQRKNSLTQSSRFDFFKRERSKDEYETKDKNERKIIKQKSIETKPEFSKSLSFKEKTKMTGSNKNITHCLQSPTTGFINMKKIEKLYNEKKSGFKSSLTKGKNVQKEEKNRDDFLKATMRIFLVVSPPAGKIQVQI